MYTVQQFREMVFQARASQNTDDLLECVEVELIDVQFRRIVARRPEVFMAESRRFADA